jgi:hypothetical protein
MMNVILSALMILLATAALNVGTASAQATRTWVSGVGDDANPCSRTAPCKTFAGAISKTATGGEINCLDPGGFGAVTITKSITISCPSTGTAGVLAAGTTGVIVANTPANAEVVLEGLDIEGFANGTSPGIHGVSILSAAKVTIQKCSIRNFTQNGVNLSGPAGARVVIVDSMIRNNSSGVSVVGVGGAANVAIVLSTIIDRHSTASVAVGAGSTLFMSGSKLFGSATNVSVAAGATFTSFGDNAIQNAGTPTNTIVLR